MANSGILETTPSGGVEETVLTSLRSLCPLAVASYESVLGVLTSNRNKLNRSDSALVTGEVAAVFSILANLARENQQLRAELLASKVTNPSGPGLIKTRPMPSGRLSALVSSSRNGNEIKSGPLTRGHLSRKTPMDVEYAPSNASGKPPMEVEYAPSNASRKSPKEVEYAPDRATRSYADVIKTRAISSSRMDSRKRPDPVLLVYPISEGKEQPSHRALDPIASARTRQLIAHVGRPDELGIAVTNVRSLRGGGIAVTCRRPEHITTLKDAIRSNPRICDKLYLVNPRLRKPRVMVHNVPDDVPVSEVVTAIRGKIVSKKLGKECETVRPLYDSKASLPNHHHWVLEVEPPALTCVVRGNLFLDWGVLSIREYIRETRCYKCNAFGHIAKYCAGKATCKRCGGDHDGEGCTNEVRCVNCVTVNSKHGKNFSVQHPASAIDCPARVWELGRLRNQICYG